MNNKIEYSIDRIKEINHRRWNKCQQEMEPDR